MPPEKCVAVEQIRGPIKWVKCAMTIARLVCIIGAGIEFTLTDPKRDSRFLTRQFMREHVQVFKQEDPNFDGCGHP